MAAVTVIRINRLLNFMGDRMRDYDIGLATTLALIAAWNIN